jgi:hypothetical protein
MAKLQFMVRNPMLKMYGQNCNVENNSRNTPHDVRNSKLFLF